MAYSMFERPKLHNVQSMKFYPEDYDHHVSFRHKNLPPDFDLSAKASTKASYSIEAHTSSKKCPIYVHTILRQNGDFEIKNDKQKKSKSKHSSVLEKLEESYWANWKPDKKSQKSLKNSQPPEIKVIKSAPNRRHKSKLYHRESQITSDFKIQHIPSRSQEIQTDDIPPIPETTGEEVKEDATKNEATEDMAPQKEDSNMEEITGDKEEKSSNEVINSKFLRHTDSLILSAKKQQEGKKSVEQPKCIRLYKKSTKTTSKSYVKGGSYPLKSCLKKESNYAKGNIRLGRPGSPVIISSNYSNKNKSQRR